MLIKYPENLKKKIKSKYLKLNEQMIIKSLKMHQTVLIYKPNM